MKITRHWLVVSGLCLLLQTSVRASAGDLGPTLADMANPAKHDAALAKIKGISVEELGGVLAAIDDDATDAGVRRSLQEALPEIYARLRVERGKQNEAIRLKWYIATGPEAYKANGKRDPKWDAKVQEGFDYPGNRLEDSFRAFDAAVNAGCDDPLVRFYRNLRGLESGNLEPDAGVPPLSSAAKDLRTSGYSAGRKCIALMEVTARSLRLGPDLALLYKSQIPRTIDVAMAQVPQMPAENMSEETLKDLLFRLYHTMEQVSLRHEAFVKVEPPFEKAFPKSAFPHALAAYFYMEWAWDARGGGYADSVTEEGWKRFGERLDKSEEEARKAWELDLLDPSAPTTMISVSLGKGYPRAVLDKWFERAMLCNPDNIEACNAKASSLLPQWGGSAEELTAFGRWCVEHGTARSGIPRILCDTHDRLRSQAEDAEAYMKQPGVWADIRLAYDKLLGDKSRMTDDRASYLRDRASFIKSACDCGQWSAALKLMNEYGDEIDMNVFGGKQGYEYSKRKAAREAAKTPG